MNWKPAVVVAIVTACVVVGAVLGLRFAYSSRAHALLYRKRASGEPFEIALMAATQSDCEAIGAAFLRDPSDREHIAEHIAIDCVPETDPRLPKKWRTGERRLGRYLGGAIYLYGPDREPSLKGAYLLMLPGETAGAPTKISRVLVDKDNCQRALDIDKRSWEKMRKIEDLPEFKTPGDAAMFAEEKRQAEGACVPLQDPERVKQEYCNGLAFYLDVAVGLAYYGCDSAALRPH